MFESCDNEAGSVAILCLSVCGTCNVTNMAGVRGVTLGAKRFQFFTGKIQTHERFKRTQFISTKHNVHIFRAVPLSGLSVVPQLDQGDNPNNLQVGFCPNKQLSFEP